MITKSARIFLQHILQKARLNYWPPVLLTSVLTGVFLMPGSTIPDVQIINLDKMVHVSAFVLLFFLWFLARPDKQTAILFLVISYGLGIEFLQEWLPLQRSFEWADVVADSAGALLGWWIGQRVKKLAEASSISN